MSVFSEEDTKLYDVMMSGGNVEKCRECIAHGAQVNFVYPGTKITPLIFASDRGLKEVVDLLLKEGADINAEDKQGFSALIAASDKGNKDVVKLLLENNANINAQDKRGFSALIVASANGNKDVVKLLLENNANTKLKNTLNETAEDRAKKSGHTEIGKYIEEYIKEKEIENRNTDGNITKSLAETENVVNNPTIEEVQQPSSIEKPKKKSSDLLPSQESDITKKPNANGTDRNPNTIPASQIPKIPTKINNDVDAQGNTALMVAVQNQDIDSLEDLITRGADIYKENKNKETALTIAKRMAEDPKNENGKDIFNSLKIKIEAKNFANAFIENNRANSTSSLSKPGNPYNTQSGKNSHGR